MVGVNWEFLVSPNAIEQLTVTSEYDSTKSETLSRFSVSGNYSVFKTYSFVETTPVTLSVEGYEDMNVVVADNNDPYIFTPKLPTIAFYKHAGVTYEIEDEKARQDIATKQDALTTQTAYSAKGSSTKVPQITTNNLGQVTGITEVTISQPTVNNKTITIQKNSTTVDSFTLNQSTDKTINITVPTKTSDITNDSGFLTSHQSIKTLKTDNTTGQTASSSETIAGSGTINLHKVSKTGSYNDLLNKPTIDTALSTTSTNAAQNKIITTELNKKIHYGDMLVNPNGKTLYMTKLDDTLYRANKRHTVTLTNFNSSMQNTASLFDMNYDTRCGIDKGNIGIINISGNINLGMNYPYGYLFISFYYNNTPLSVDQVSIRIYQNWSGHNVGWVDVGHPEIDYESGRPYVMKKFLQYYGMQQIEISIDNTEGTGTEGEKRIDVTQVEFFCNRTGVSSLPVLTKLGGDTIYGNLTIPTADGSFIGNLTGTADKATKDASGNTITATYATKSELPTVNNKTITIQKNSTTVDSFTLNQSTDKTINISVPTTAADVGAVPTTRTVNGKALSSDISLTASDVGAISSHQSIKTLKTDNTTAQTTSSSEAITGSGIINLHKVSKTGSYSDLLNKPTIPTVNNSTITIQKNGTNIDSFTTNTASGKNINITLAKGDVGLGNVDNTSDLDKPISTATQTALDAKQNTISDLGYIRNQVAKVDDKISAIDVTDSGDSLPSASGYNLNDTFLNKTDKKLYKTLAPAYQLNTNVTTYKSNASIGDINVDLTTGIATGFNYTSSYGSTNYNNINRTSVSHTWNNPLCIHINTGEYSAYTGYVACLGYSMSGNPYYYYLTLSISKASTDSPRKFKLIAFYYWNGSFTTIFSYDLFDITVEANTEYYIYITHDGEKYISTISSTGYNVDILETSTIEESTSPSTSSIYYGGPSTLGSRSSTYKGMSVYLLDSFGDFLVPDGALTWDSGTTLEDNTQYNDTTNEKTIYYNNNILYEDGSGLPDQSGQSGKYLTTDGTTASWATVQAGPKFLTFTNVTASNWVSDSTYTGYEYKCILTCSGVTSSDYAQVIFGPDQANSGNYTSVCLTGTNSVTIYSKVNTSIVIPTIAIMGV